MAFDAHIEDFQRVALRGLHKLEAHDRFAGVRLMGELRRAYDEGRPAEAQTDADRAFHLVVRATEHYDYELPFVTNEEAAQKLVDKSKRALAEAQQLDPMSADAQRMLLYMDGYSFDESSALLEREAPHVEERCAKELEAYLETLSEPEFEPIARAIFMAPAWRWYASWAERALICGRYSQCVRICEQLAAKDPSDAADIYRIQAYALAKLQDPAPLALLASRVRRRGRWMPDAWLSLAQVYVAWSQRKFDRAAAHLKELIGTYAEAGLALTHQTEINFSAFSRVVVMPQSEDELVIAVSEAAVLLQEAQDSDGRGGFGTWLREHPLVREALARETKDLFGATNFEEAALNKLRERFARTVDFNNPDDDVADSDRPTDDEPTDTDEQADKNHQADKSNPSNPDCSDNPDSSDNPGDQGEQDGRDNDSESDAL